MGSTRATVRNGMLRDLVKAFKPSRYAAPSIAGRVGEGVKIVGNGIDTTFHYHSDNDTWCTFVRDSYKIVGGEYVWSYRHEPVLNETTLTALDSVRIWFEDYTDNDKVGF